MIDATDAKSGRLALPIAANVPGASLAVSRAPEDAGCGEPRNVFIAIDDVSPLPISQRRDPP